LEFYSVPPSDHGALHYIGRNGETTERWNDGMTERRNDRTTKQQNDSTMVQRNDGTTERRNDGLTELATERQNDGTTERRNDRTTSMISSWLILIHLPFQYEIIASQYVRNEKTYACCPNEIYPNVKSSFQFKMKQMFESDTLMTP
jgi:hypothetical protein